MKKTIIPRFFLLLICFVLIWAGCRTASEKAAETSAAGGTELSAAEQDEKALELFHKIFDTVGNNERKEILGQIEAMYLEIVNKYPKATLVQESYWRLILIYLNDYNPPAYEKIETTYARYIKEYPSSPFRSEIEDNISKMYYREGKWDNLVRFYSPAVKNFIATGQLTRPQDIFLYSEAKMKLGDLAEAEKGYRIVIVNFPKSREASLSRQRLDAIKDIRSRQN